MPINTTPSRANPIVPPRSFWQRHRTWIIIGGFLIAAVLALAAMMYYSTKPAQAQEAESCRIQRQLAKRGFYDGDIDCSVGPATREAVRAFQRDQNLFVDGEVGEDTYKRLFGRFRHERGEDGDRDSDRGADVAGRCAEEPIEATVMRATEQRGRSGAVKSWEALVLRKEGLGLAFSTWGDATDVALSCKKIASWNWNCIAKGRPCRSK